MYHGLLPVIKPKGMTSHDVVFKARKLLKMKKIGHTGTLDPSVEGVLLLCLGQGTKLVELLMDGVKGYRGEITLGRATETEDADGAVIESQAVSAPLSNEVIDQAMQRLTGTITQVPPMYSAVKVAGKRLYEYARAGEQVERPVRQAEIYRFDRLNEPLYDESEQTQRWSFDVLCGKGTYVRTLAVDLGQLLGYPSHMSALYRYQTGGFSASESYTLAQIADYAEQGRLAELITPLAQAVRSFPALKLNASQYQAVRHGKVLPGNYFEQAVNEPTALFYEERVYAIYQPHPTQPNLIKPLRMFVYDES